MTAENNVLDDGYCFACGKNNPIGLKLAFTETDGKFVTTKTLPKEYQSYNGIVHGGIVTTLLDEAMGGMLFAKGEHAVTATISVKYRKPTPVGEPLTITGWEESRRRNIVSMKATVALSDGTITAEGTAKMVVVE